MVLRKCVLKRSPTINQLWDLFRVLFRELIRRKTIIKWPLRNAKCLACTVIIIYSAIWAFSRQGNDNAEEYESFYEVFFKSNYYFNFQLIFYHVKHQDNYTSTQNKRSAMD